MRQIQLAGTNFLFFWSEKVHNSRFRFLYLRQNLLERLPDGLLSGKRHLSILSLDELGKAECPGGRRRCSYRWQIVLKFFKFYFHFFMVVGIKFIVANSLLGNALLLISWGFVAIAKPQPKFGKVSCKNFTLQCNRKCKAHCTFWSAATRT